jgi:hypothetical protein
MVRAVLTANVKSVPVVSMQGGGEAAEVVRDLRLR